jgi:hypothetical protein
VSASDVIVTDLLWIRGTEETIQSSATADIVRWEDVALDDPQRFAAEMVVLGLQDEQIQSALKLVDSVHADIRRTVWGLGEGEYPPPRAPPTPEQAAEERQVYNSARASAVDRMTDWMRHRSIRIEERTTIQVRLPLFLISAAAIPGCTTSFMIESTEVQDVGWSVTILGTGLGADSTVHASASATFRAAAGEAKLIFLPVTLVVELVSILHRGKSVSQGHRIDVSGLSQQRANPGLLLLSADSTPPFGRREARYELAGDPTGEIASFELMYGRTRKLPLRVGIKAFGSDLGLHFQAEIERRVTMAYDLRGGYDYELYRIAEGDGILWRADRPPRSRARSVLSSAKRRTRRSNMHFTTREDH